MSGLLIGLTGAAGAGKDTVGDVLKALGWRGMAFADALRIEVATAWRIDISVLVDRKGKEQPQPLLAAEWCQHAPFLHWAACQSVSLHEPRSPRWVMQTWGSYRRWQSALWWVNHVDGWVACMRHQHPTTGLVITDVRHANEADMVRQRGGHVVRVIRPGLAGLAADTAGHVSEREASAIVADIELHNDGDLQHLAAETHRVLQVLQAQPEPAAP